MTDRARDMENELKKCKEELELREWGLKKTGEAIKHLYNDLAEKNKKLQELDQLKTDFVATVSHELRTPLAIIKEFILIVADEIPGSLTPEQKECVAVIKNNIDRLSRLIENLLDISRIERGKAELKKTRVDLVNSAVEVASSLRPKANDKNIELKVLFSQPRVDIRADRDKITQALTNLIENAIKFTPREGRVTVEVKDGPKEVECGVSDTGIGIAPEDIDKLFVRFQRVGRPADFPSKGTGLGLAITKALIDMHGGRIWVESTPARGSKFIFTLPKEINPETKLEEAQDGKKDIDCRR